MKKVVLILIGALLLVAIGGGIWFWNAMQQPLYEPGMVRAGKNLGAPLVPPTQAADKDYWLVENDIKLFHFVDGSGANVLVVHGGPGFPIAEPLAGLKPLTTKYRF
jgi:proline iminopeptidase